MAPRRNLVVAAVIEKDGKVLACQRRRSDRHPLKWEFPGGKVERGEKPREALARELREELDIEAEIGPELKRYRFAYPNKPAIELIFFRVTRFERDVKNCVFEQLAWDDAANMPNYDFLEGDLDFIRRLARGEFATKTPPTPGPPDPAAPSE